MKCNDKTIKEILSAYLTGELDFDGRLRVERHLEMCEDCRTEMNLLRMMAEEPVPEPGEAFWAQMPSRIYRDVQKHKKRRRGEWLTGFLQGVYMPRWAWATAAVVMVAAISWFLFRPAPVEIAVAPPSDDEAAYEAALSAEPVDVAGLTSSELDAVAKWAGTEFTSIREAASKEMSVSTERGITERGIYEDLEELSPQELERLYSLIEKWKREG